MRRALIAFLILIAGIGSSPARADITYPGQAAVTDPVSVQAIDVATSYWRTRGLTGCPDGIRTWMADDLTEDDGDAIGRGGDCEAWLERLPLEGLRTYLDHPTIGDRRFAAQDECREWTHEIGHALGLAHTTDGGVMDPVKWSVPGECVAWAHRLYPHSMVLAVRRHEHAVRAHHRLDRLAWHQARRERARTRRRLRP